VKTTHTVTAEDIEMKRFPNENLKEGDVIEIEVGSEKTEDLDKETAERLASYKKHYPDEKVFHMTSDGQFFLDANKTDAINHQKLLDENKNVKVLKA
jgi:hypothetical protein